MPIVIPKNELNEFSLPRVCVVTGKQGEVTFQKVEFQFIPHWVRGLAIIPLLYLILMLAMRKYAKGTMPFSEEGWARVVSARRIMAVAGIIFLVSMISGFAMLTQRMFDDVAPLILVFGFIAALIGVGVGSFRIRKAFPFATLIDDVNVTLTLPSSEAERVIRTHLESGKQRA